MAVRIGTSAGEYEWADGWAKIPPTQSLTDGWSHHGVVVTDNDEVIAFHPGDPEMLVFDLDGNLLRSWSTDLKDAHGMALAKDSSGQYLWTSDPGAKRAPEIDYEYGAGPRAGKVVKWSLDGKDVLRLERPDHPAYKDGEYSPTSVTVFEEASDGNGDIWSSDGYGQSLIHRYDKSGNYLSTIDGTEGSGGRFDCPHGVWVDYRKSEPELYVADRANSQIQVYDLEGQWKRAFGSDWLTTPSAFAISGDLMIVAELQARLTVIDGDDNLVGYLGSDDDVPSREGWPNVKSGDELPRRPETLSEGKFNSPHGVAADKNGNLYVPEWLIGGRFTKLVKV
ncbi:MAG: hypothetical protein HQ478_01140 [Chloroflexi bacterium]|nr:hypothetical protein [Chloroflexota bacterium]